MSEAPAPAKRARPLSPHLQVYRLPMTANMSITYRATGVALSAGTLVLAWLLIAAATGPEAYDLAAGFAASWLGQLMLFGWSLALFYHLCNGVRHLVWDTGRLFKKEDANRAGYVVLAATLLLTAAFWYAARINPGFGYAAPGSQTMASSSISYPGPAGENNEE
jgi:succinate dehydrogenase / fumarate reductase, cytochrome b subunit